MFVDYYIHFMKVADNQGKCINFCGKEQVFADSRIHSVTSKIIKKP